MQKVSFREDVRLRHSIQADDFVVTFELDSDSCSNDLSRQSIWKSLGEMLEKKFNSSFILIFFGEADDKRPSKPDDVSLFLSNRSEFLKYLAAADLHVQALDVGDVTSSH